MAPDRWIFPHDAAGSLTLIRPEDGQRELGITARECRMELRQGKHPTLCCRAAFTVSRSTLSSLPRAAALSFSLLSTEPTGTKGYKRTDPCVSPLFPLIFLSFSRFISRGLCLVPSILAVVPKVGDATPCGTVLVSIATGEV